MLFLLWISMPEKIGEMLRERKLIDKDLNCPIRRSTKTML